MGKFWRGVLLLLGGFAGLCALVAGLAAGFDAWRERVHASWPAATAHVERCGIHEYKSRGLYYSIRCRFAYKVAGEALAAQLGSGSVPDPAQVIARTPGFPTLGDLQAWVDAHPAGTVVELHYDPDSPGDAALVDTDMPLAGPHSPVDLQLAAGFALASLVLLLIGIVWGRLRRG